jgi:hypothetical protein
MPTVKRPDVLTAVYDATSALISRGDVPSTMVPHSHTIFRSVASQHLLKPGSGGHVSRQQANQALMPRDGSSEANNRFSGPSYNAAIPAAAGLYCVLQQQALVNEIMHYSKKPGSSAFADKCVFQIRLMSSINCVDLSPHNPGHSVFLSINSSTLPVFALRLPKAQHLEFTSICGTKSPTETIAPSRAASDSRSRIRCITA